MLHHLIIVSFLQCWLQYPSIVHLFFAAKESLWCKLILSVMFLSWAVMNCHSVSLTMDPAQLHIYAKQSRASRNCCCLDQTIHPYRSISSMVALMHYGKYEIASSSPCLSRHKHAKLLKHILHFTSSNLKTPSIFTRLKARSSALRKKNGQDIDINTSAHPHSSIIRPASVEKPPPACLPDTLSTCQPWPPADMLSIFSDFDAVKAHMYGNTN